MDVLHDGLVAIVIVDLEANIAEDVGPIVRLKLFNDKFHELEQMLSPVCLGTYKLDPQMGSTRHTRKDDTKLRRAVDSPTVSVRAVGVYVSPLPDAAVIM